MGVVTGGGGAAFNGGTITQPLTVLETDGTSAGIVINTQGGNGVDAIAISAPHSVVTLDGDGNFFFNSDDGARLAVRDTGGNRCRATVSDDVNNKGAGMISDLGLYHVVGSEQATFSVGAVITTPAVPATATLTMGTGAQLSTATDVHAYTPVTFNPTAGAAATCAVAISKDGTNYTALWTETEPAGVAFDGTIHGINVYVPAGWKLKLTVTNATIGTTTYY